MILSSSDVAPEHNSSSRRATLADVAALAGVSSATASKAISGRQRVSPAARQRVLTAAQELNFSPNHQAQSLARGRSGTVGLITHDLEGRFSTPILMGAEDEFGLGRMPVLLCNSRGDSIREQYHADALIGRQVDGLIVVGARPDPRPSLGALEVPVVYAYAPSEDASDMSVLVDNELTGRLAAEHIINCGRRNIAVIAGDHSYGAATDRVRGISQVLGQHDLLMVGGAALYGAWTEEWGRGATHRLIDRYGKDRIDGVICGSDQIARGVLDALREIGVHVPAEVSVIGSDNWNLLAASARPPLTTIDMNLEELGRHAATRLIQAMEGHMQPGVEHVEPRLVVRGSTTA